MTTTAEDNFQIGELNRDPSTGEPLMSGQSLPGGEEYRGPEDGDDRPVMRINGARFGDPV